MNYQIVTICDKRDRFCENCPTNCLSKLENLENLDFIIIDLSNLKSINSILLTNFMKYRKKIILCNPSEISKSIISVMKVDKVMKVFDTVEEAIDFATRQSKSLV